MSRLKKEIDLLENNINKTCQLLKKNNSKKNKKNNSLTVEERISKIFDSNSDPLEIGFFAGWEMYKKHGGCPNGGVLVKIGYINSHLCIVIANNPAVKAGAWFPITIKKILRAQEISLQNNIPIVYLVDSAGVYLPLQEDVFPDKEGFGRVFFNNSKISTKGIIQISAIMGSCVAGGAYLPAMSDEALIVKDNGFIFLAAPYLVKAAIGEDSDKHTLGGATMHSTISGVTDNIYNNDEECIEAIRKIFDTIPKKNNSAEDNLPLSKFQKPKYNISDLFEIFPKDNSMPYDMLEIIERIVDKSEFDQYKNEYGKTILCGYSKIEGKSIGIIANQRKVVKDGLGELQIGGVIYPDSAKKAAQFINNSNMRGIPLLFIQDVTGFMVGKKAERQGIINDGAEMIKSLSNSTVPKITIIIGNSYGAGHYAMCGTAYDPNFIFAWPTAKIAVMNKISMFNTLSKLNKNLDSKRKEDFYKEYNNKTTPYYAASRMWIDGIINPLDTRKTLSYILELL